MDRQTDGQMDRQTGRQAGRQTASQTNKSASEAGRQAGRWTDRQTDGQTGRQAGRQAGRRMHRQTYTQTGPLRSNLPAAQAVSGCLHQRGVQTQPSSNVEGVGAARDPPQQAVSRGQLPLIELHACILKGGVLKLQGCE